MSTTVDERVLEMRFDNKQFESNVATTMSTLDKLKRSLSMTEASKGLENVNAAASKCDLSNVGRGAENIRAKFSALSVAGVTALANITNSAVNAGKRIVSALTIDPIKMGFQEYETQINAVQTILANTQSKGTTLKDVNGALDELNTYADKTIYNFTEMTRNIGTFTAAGVDLDTSVAAIKGIANLAAVSGSNSQQASTAMYQLSQALASGTVKLMDWNSVVNAGMGGQVFQDALKETARVHGVNIDEMIKKEGSFRETLKDGWLTSSILTETLSKFTGDLNEQQLKSMGYTDEQIKEILKLGKTANDAATKVKTFTQLFDTLKEAAQSGWTQSWEIIIGDFEEAKTLLTEVSDTIGKVIGDSADARNKLLQGWKDLGGRTALIDGFKNAFEGIVSIIKPINEAFRDIFPPLTAKRLLSFTENFRDLTAKLKLNEERADKVKRTFKGLFSILDIGKKAITALLKPLFNLAESKGISSLADLFLDITAAIGDFFTSINEGFNTGSLSGGLSKIVSGISNVLEKGTNGLKGFGSVLSSVGDWVAKVAGKIWDSLGKVFTWVTDNVSAGDIFAGLAGGGIFLSAKKFIGLINKIKDAIDGLFNKKDGDEGIKGKFTNILDSLHNSLESFTSGIKVASLVGIAIAIGVLTHSVKTLSEIKAVDIGKSLGAIGAMLAMLSFEFKSLTKTLTRFDSKGIIKSSFSLILVAASINILAKALVKISDLSMGEIVKGLAGVGGGLIALSVGLKIIGKTKISLSTSIAILALAESCKMLGNALQEFGSMSWDEIGRGLTAMGAALLELTGVLAIMGKVGGSGTIIGSISLLIAVQSLDNLAEALKSFGSMSWDKIARGLVAMGGALGELGLVLGLLGKFAGFSGIFGAISILIAVQSLDKLSSALQNFGLMSWGEIGRGLTAMGGALGELGLVLGLLGKLGGFSSLLAAGSLLLLIQGLDDMANALQKFGSMSWDEIGRGLVAMGGALGELSLICGLLGGIAGFSALIGAGSILLLIQGLDDMANALQKFGSMSWDEIGRGLVAMGGALLEVAGISGALGALAGMAGILGAGSILITVKGLGDIADALKKFGEMSWDEIGRGLTAMGAALGEIALGGLLNTLSGLGSISIANVAEPLGVLADSVKKWVGITVPENLGLQLGMLASGISNFTFAGWGASAIAEVAAPLGTLADSVKKWTGVIVPEGLGEQLKTLASGVKSFTWAGLGSGSISEVAAPLGTLADSVKKWAGVTVPENIESSLRSISNGVKSFSWAFMGGWSIGAIVEPLGKLPDSVKKWNGITVPEGLEKGLKSISSGVKSFTWAFMGGWSIGAITGPLGDLAGSIKKWKDVSVPESVTDGLKSISSGVKSFTWAFMGGWSLSEIVDPLNKLANAAKKLSAAKIPSDIGDKLKSFASGVKAFTGISDISSISSGIKSLASSATNFSGINFKSINSGLNSFVTTIKKVGNANIDTKALTSSISSIHKMMKTINSTIKSNKSSINSSMKVAMSGMVTAIKSSTNSVRSAISAIISALKKAIVSKKSYVTSAFKSLVSGAASAIKEKRSSFESAGKHLGSGLVEGIKSKYDAAYKAGYALGQKAAQGEKDGQKSNSPSKLTIQNGKWLGEGLIIGICKMARPVYEAGYEIGKSATKSISSAISKISGIIDSDMDMQPTIRPVLDLSNVRSGADTINGLLNFNSSIGVMPNVNAISSMMSRRNQNGINDDVVSAIKDLNNKISNISANTYNINGITYDDGSNIGNAIETIVRAARVESRV